MRAVGLMSGTSLDGVDAALVDIRPRGSGYDVRLDRFITVPFSTRARSRLLAALTLRGPDLSELVALDHLVGEMFAAAARKVAPGEAVDFIASHGLTAFHDGVLRRTFQIGDPYRLREELGATVVFDFRRADCAAGGHGAPLVPYVDALLFTSSERNIVALNIGGIANVTVLEAGAAAAPRAWDTGPGNMLLDAFVRGRTDGRWNFDADGAAAAQGRANEGVVTELIAREASFLALGPPKSTGRERFGAQCLEAHADLMAAMSLEDGCATLCAFTAATIAQSLAAHGPLAPLVIASGGGVHNRALLTMLRERLGRDDAALALSSDFGVDPDAKEALAFALLGYETLRGRPANVPAATGAAHPAVLGAIAPHGLADVLTKMSAEVAANESA
ncbi:MAG: anhydro-N-acetylmuramic acid kinase [Candidatus Eremiobacteraeota bacterium]|nr:anhydro-N-acetylmuramic acid kinase [Candidatus Eremiobacteraeota bacterium]MBC5821595.1 anhydro-N-acetylmuramic acid kinase [Candidatus Eremiobacteraeota bacterium]